MRACATKPSELQNKQDRVLVNLQSPSSSRNEISLLSLLGMMEILAMVMVVEGLEPEEHLFQMSGHKDLLT